MKKGLVVLLVVLLVVTGLPILMTMSGTAACSDCGPALAVGAGCTLAVLVAGIAMILSVAARRHASRDPILRLPLLSFLLERPPRPA